MSDIPAHIAASRSLGHRGLNWLAEVLALRAEDKVIRRSRERLAEYDDRLLSDIGLTREQALGHASRPEWAAPDLWATTRAR